MRCDYCGKEFQTLSGYRQHLAKMERVLTMLPKTVVDELDRAAAEQGLSRSALVRTLVIRYLRRRGLTERSEDSSRWSDGGLFHSE